MSFFARGGIVWYRGDNLPEEVRVARTYTEKLAMGIAAALNLSHVDVEVHGEELRIVGPGVE